MAFIPSAQQATVFSWINKGKGNSFVQAVAGAGKTTTLINGAKQMKGSILLVAFNKKIADELASRISMDDEITNADAKTFHSIGLTAWTKFSGKFPKITGYKVNDIIRDLKIDEDYANFVKKLVSLAKQTGLQVHDDVEKWNALVERHDLDADLAKGCTVTLGVQYAIDVLEANNQNLNVVDFDDMIYFPVLKKIKMPVQYDWVLVDEAQDTNPVRRMLAKMLCKPNGRMIWVGDKHQAIYGFTGADADAVDQIIREFRCSELPLTVTYRCPKAVVTAAKAYVNHIEAHETAPEGKVSNISNDDFTKIMESMTPNDAILCRKNAPLVKTAYRLIKQGIACQIEGKSDIGQQILMMLNKWKRVKTLADFLDKLTEWEATQITKHSDAKGVKKGKEMLVESIKDRAETIRVLCEGCPDLNCVRNKVETMFGDLKDGEKSRRVILSSVHKSKGREWNNVYVLGFNEYMPSKMAKQAWQQEQEKNLIYVAFTRAQATLTLVG